MAATSAAEHIDVLIVVVAALIGSPDYDLVISVSETGLRGSPFRTGRDPFNATHNEFRHGGGPGHLG